MDTKPTPTATSTQGPRRCRSRLVQALVCIAMVVLVALVITLLQVDWLRLAPGDWLDIG